MSKWSGWKLRSYFGSSEKKNSIKGVHCATAAIVFVWSACGFMCYHLDGRPMNKYRVWEACNALQISWVGAKSSDSAKTIKEEKTSLGTCLKMIPEVRWCWEQIICWKHLFALWVNWLIWLICLSRVLHNERVVTEYYQGAKQRNKLFLLWYCK